MKGGEKRKEGERDKRLTWEVEEKETTTRKNNHFYYDYNFVGRVCTQLLLFVSCLYNVNDDV